MMDYDPNLTYSGRMALQTVRLTFGLWKYRHIATVIVDGNCRGLNVVEGAIEAFYDKLQPNQHNNYKSFHMTDPEGNVLTCDECEADRDAGDWLKDMLIAAEIIDIKPKGIEKMEIKNHKVQIIDNYDIHENCEKKFPHLWEEVTAKDKYSISSWYTLSDEAFEEWERWLVQYREMGTAAD